MWDGGVGEPWADHRTDAPMNGALDADEKCVYNSYPCEIETRCPFRKSSASVGPCFLAWLQVIFAAKLAASLRYAVLVLDRPRRTGYGRGNFGVLVHRG